MPLVAVHRIFTPERRIISVRQTRQRRDFSLPTQIRVIYVGQSIGRSDFHINLSISVVIKINNVV